MKSKIEKCKNWEEFNINYLKKSKDINEKALANLEVPMKRGNSFITELNSKNQGFGN